MIGDVRTIIITLLLSVLSVLILTISIEGKYPNNTLSKIKRLLLFVSSIMILSNVFAFVILGFVGVLTIFLLSLKKHIFKEEINEVQ